MPLTTITTISMIYKLLDLLHDHLLHPIFKDDEKNIDYDAIMDKLNEIEAILQSKRDKKNGCS